MEITSFRMNGKSQVIISGVLVIGIVLILATIYFKPLATSDSYQEINIPIENTTTVDTPTAHFTELPHNPGVSVSPASEPLGSVPDEWETVVNKKYGFSYRVPSGLFNEHFYISATERPEDLKSYVQDIWGINKYDKNPYTKDKQISEINEITINNNKGYQFTLTRSFSSDTEGSGYVLDEPNIFTFFETQQGVKIITRGPLKSSDRGEQMYLTILNSLTIDSALIPQNEKPGNWQTITRQSFSFKFPGNLFVPDATINSEERIYLSDIADNLRGGIMISVKDEKFDPTNIIGMYGEIDNAKRVEIGNKVWYSYVWGDAGAMSQIYLTDNNGKTLKVSFGCMPEEVVYPLSTDFDLQKLILATISEQ